VFFNPNELVFFYQGSPIKNTTINVQQTINDIFIRYSETINFDPLELDIRVYRVDKRLMKQNKYMEILLQEQNLLQELNVSPGHTIIATMMNDLFAQFFKHKY
jgi:hypothetical protein